MRQQIETALLVLQRGGLVAYPTDTVYGLGADAANPDAVRRVFAAKRRPADLPLPLLAADLDMLHRAAPGAPEDVLARLSAFIPGALTIVAPAAPWVPPEVTAGGPSVAVRVPGHDLCRALCAALGGPIVGTSANLSGGPTPRTADEVVRQLGDSVDYVIEGECSGGVESTVLDLTVDPPNVLRHGAIAEETLRQALGTAPAAK